jgi:hypothetical protein
MSTVTAGGIAKGKHKGQQADMVVDRRIWITRAGRQVVSTRLDIAHAISLLIETRHDHQRQQTGRRIGSESSADVEAVEIARHPSVEQHNVRDSVCDRRQSRRPGGTRQSLPD